MSLGYAWRHPCSPKCLLSQFHVGECVDPDKLTPELLDCSKWGCSTANKHPPTEPHTVSCAFCPATKGMYIVGGERSTGEFSKAKWHVDPTAKDAIWTLDSNPNPGVHAKDAGKWICNPCYLKYEGPMGPIYREVQAPPLAPKPSPALVEYANNGPDPITITFSDGAAIALKPGEKVRR